MQVLAVDPGDEFSAWLVYDGENPVRCAKTLNAELLLHIRDSNELLAAEVLAIETLKPRGMPTSFEEMQTQLWAGRFIEAWGGAFQQIFRHDVKMHICGNARANDSNIRQALIDRWGGDAKAIGGVKCKRCKGKGWTGRDHATCNVWEHPPGPLHDVTADMWSALAIAVTYCETLAARRNGT